MAGPKRSSSSSHRGVRRSSSNNNNNDESAISIQQHPAYAGGAVGRRSTTRGTSTRTVARGAKNDNEKPAAGTAVATRSSRRIASSAAVAAAAAAAPDSTTTTHNNNKRKTTADDRVGGSGGTGLTIRTSSARSVTQPQTLHVTPSPAVASSAAAAGTNFAFETPPRKTRKGRGGGKILTELHGETITTSSGQPRLPKGVVDLFAYTTRDLHRFDVNDDDDDPFQEVESNSVSPEEADDVCHHCHGRPEVCTAESLSAEFIRSYGHDYWKSLKEREGPAVPYPVSPDDRTRIRGSPLLESSQGSGGTSGGGISASQGSDSSGGSSNRHHRQPLHELLLEEDWTTPPNRKSLIHPTTWARLAPRLTRLLKRTNRRQGPIESTDFLMYQPELTPKMRTILVDWLIELSDHFHFGPATLHRAITLVDMVLACGPLGNDRDEDARDYGEADLEEEEDDEQHTAGASAAEDGDNESGSRLSTCYFVSRNRFQLLGATCTWMACKLLETTPPTLSEIAYVSDHIYSSKQIKRMERRVCNALEFHLVAQPTPFLFLHEYLRASQETIHPSCFYEFGGHMAQTTTTTQSSVLVDLASYLLELGRMPYAPATRPPSLLAAAVVYLARVTLSLRSQDRSLCAEGWWTPTLQYYTGYTKAELRETVVEIHLYHLSAESSNLKAAFAKYKLKRHHRVALKTVARREDMGFEAHPEE